MEYQIFEIMVLFSIYSILGWLVTGFGSVLAGKGFCNRGLWSGFYQPAAGLGALAVLYGAEYFKQTFVFERMWEPVLFLVLGVVTGIVFIFLHKIVINSVCGYKLFSFRWYFPFLTGLAAVIVGIHLNNIIGAYIRWMSPWIHFLFLLIFWTKFLSEVMDVLFGLGTFKKKVHLLSNRE